MCEKIIIVEHRKETRDFSSRERDRYSKVVSAIGY